MRRQGTWTVGSHGIRPAGEPTKCFYCGQSVGGVHKEGCVIRSRTVVLRFSVELVVATPESWDIAAIEGLYNDGSWCGDNVLGEITEVLERIDGRACLCPVVAVEFVREANAADEQAQCLFVENLPK